MMLFGFAIILSWKKPNPKSQKPRNVGIDETIHILIPILIPQSLNSICKAHILHTATTCFFLESLVHGPPTSHGPWRPKINVSDGWLQSSNCDLAGYILTWIWFVPALWVIPANGLLADTMRSSRPGGRGHSLHTNQRVLQALGVWIIRKWQQHLSEPVEPKHSCGKRGVCSKDKAKAWHPDQGAKGSG